MMRTEIYALILAAAVFAGCAPHQDVPQTNIAKPEEAVAAFVSQWKELVEPKIPEARMPYLPQLPEAKDKLSARRSTYQACLSRVNDTVTEADRKSLIVFGSLPDLKRKGNCWAIESLGGSKTGIAGYLDPTTGKLVFAWLVPEG